MKIVIFDIRFAICEQNNGSFYEIMSNLEKLLLAKNNESSYLCTAII